jgi:mono/diheme cytochrome c family protein
MNPIRCAAVVVGIVLSALLVGCQTVPTEPDPTPEQMLIDQGRALFFEETFAGNGRTCGSCHPVDNNFTIEPKSIARLPADDPLFVAEFVPALAENFENPRLMRDFGLILENLDGFGDLENVFTQRGVPHTLGMRVSVDSRDGPRTGWSGDGAPLDGSLRAFSVGAVIQHFTLTTNRIAGVDFRLPTEDELDALEAFMLAQGRQEDLVLPLPLKGSQAARGQELFNDIAGGKCFGCHVNAGANANPGIFGEGVGNINFDTGVETLPDQPADSSGELIPPDDGFGVPGNGEFNTPPLVEAADTAPFFHNNSVATLEGAVAFYNGDAFNNSPAGLLVSGATGGPINLDATQVEAVAAFLRVINALENIRAATELLEAIRDNRRLVGRLANEQPTVAIAEIEDGMEVLATVSLHPGAVAALREAHGYASDIPGSTFTSTRSDLASKALQALGDARDDLIES